MRSRARKSQPGRAAKRASRNVFRWTERARGARAVPGRLGVLLSGAKQGSGVAARAAKRAGPSPGDPYSARAVRRAPIMSLSDRERAEGFLLSEAKQGSGERASPGVLRYGSAVVANGARRRLPAEPCEAGLGRACLPRWTEIGSPLWPMERLAVPTVLKPHRDRTAGLPFPGSRGPRMARARAPGHGVGSASPSVLCPGTLASTPDN